MGRCHNLNVSDKVKLFKAPSGIALWKRKEVGTLGVEEASTTQNVVSYSAHGTGSSHRAGENHHRPSFRSHHQDKDLECAFV